MLIFPTRHIEGFPLVIFKAVAVGMPVITTQIRAAADYLHEPENCLFCTQSPENIAEKVIELIENKDVREQMSANNINFGNTLSPRAIAEEYSAIYQRILQK
jgi:glycosyltransferase involved in cell wall biosynthesis